jgi:Flp pilus assembly protein TadB
MRPSDATRPARTRDYFVFGLALGCLWAIARHPGTCGCVLLFLVAAVVLTAVIVIVLAIKIWWLGLLGTLLVIAWVLHRKQARS